MIFTPVFLLQTGKMEPLATGWTDKEADQMRNMLRRIDTIVQVSFSSTIINKRIERLYMHMDVYAYVCMSIYVFMRMYVFIVYCMFV